MVYPAIAVGNYFLEVAERAKSSLTPMKIQKLVYFAHGWHLALKDGPLIVESVEAWEYGPVVPELYHELKKFGSGVVTGRMTRLVAVGDGSLNVMFERPTITDSETQTLVDKVWNVYGGFDAVTLSAMTHRADTPWSEVRRDNPGKRGVDIPDLKMKAYFQQLAQQNRTAAAASV
jgi:uncharacterized phage-associated protein